MQTFFVRMNNKLKIIPLGERNYSGWEMKVAGRSFISFGF
jgi:hypothetical protein